MTKNDSDTELHRPVGYPQTKVNLVHFQDNRELNPRFEDFALRCTMEKSTSEASPLGHHAQPIPAHMENGGSSVTFSEPVCCQIHARLFARAMTASALSVRPRYRNDAKLAIRNLVVVVFFHGQERHNNMHSLHSGKSLQVYSLEMYKVQGKETCTPSPREPICVVAERKRQQLSRIDRFTLKRTLM